MKTLSTVIAAVLAAAAVASVPLSASAANVATEEFTFAYDLKSELLDSAAGVEAVYADLERSAREACSYEGVRGLHSVDAACVADLVEKVIAASGSAALDQFFAERNGATFEVAAR